MRYVTATQGKCDFICIGRQGENKVVTVQFDVSGWQEMYGSGSFSLLHQRSADMSAYPCVITSDTNTVSWVITSTDVFYVGNGRAQLLYIVDDKVAKSVVFTTNTLQSLNAGDAPDPEPEWITDVVNAGLDAEAYAIGERNGDPVSEDDPAYHNNAKYYADLASSDKVFFVAKDVTTIAQIVSAIEGGLFPVLKYVYTASGRNMTLYMPLINDDRTFSNRVFSFACFYPSIAYFATVQQNRTSTIWSELHSLQIPGVDSSSASSSRFVLGAENKVLTTIFFDDAPKANSSKLVDSKGIYNAINDVGTLLISKGLITQAEWDAR